jgi:outer membrane protein
MAPATRKPRLRQRGSSLACALGLLLAGCIHRPPDVDGVAGAPEAPNTFWTPPEKLQGVDNAQMAQSQPPPTAGEAAAALKELTLTDVVAEALRNNPGTRASWAQALAAGDAYGVQRGTLLPTFSTNATATQSQTVASTVRFGGRRRQGTVGLALSYLVLDLGGRSGGIRAAKEQAIAAGMTHNATVQNVIAQAEQAYFGYMSGLAVAEAAKSSVDEARANLDAAQSRQRVGLATIADELQARTALSQAQLALETAQGNLQAARATLAVAMGLPANVPFDVQPHNDTIQVGVVAQNVDSLVAEAVHQRPDLAAALALARSSHADVGRTRAGGLPSISLNANGGRQYSDVSAFAGDSYTLSLTLQVPLFSGFSQRYSVLEAQAQAAAADAAATGLRQQVVQQVVTSYYALQTAYERVRTADDLLASAQQSEQVARARYREGVGTILDLLTAQSALADARSQQAQSRWVWEAALAQLARDAGVLRLSGATHIPLVPDTADARIRQRDE